MKLVGLVYFILTLMVSSLPCSDGFEDQTASIDHIEKAIGCKQQGISDCTSICSCNCCGQRIISTDMLKLGVRTFFIPANIAIAYGPDYSSADVDRIWQPPKIDC